MRECASARVRGCAGAGERWQGFRYEREVIDAGIEAAMLEHVRDLPFRELEFQGYTAKRRVISFGWQYDFDADG